MLEIHAVAKLWPAMSDADFTALVDDIREQGQQVPIQLYDGQIIDGVHRYKACVELDVEPDTEDWDGTEAQLIPHVVSLNDRRRHLTTSQRAMIAEKIASRQEGRPSETDSIESVSRADAAKLLNVGPSSVQRARRVQDDGVPELAEAVEKGDISVSQASKIAKLPKPAQRKAITTPKPKNPRLCKHRGTPIPERVARAIDTIETMVEILDTARASLNGDSGRTEWSRRLRPARQKVSRFIAWCEMEEG